MTNKRTKNLKGQHIVIIGNGIAGNSAISAIRKFDEEVGVTVISEEEEPLYSPCAFYKYLAGEMKKQALFLKMLEDYRREGVRLILGQKVTEVDVKSRKVLIGDRSIYFDKLILATGSKALFPPIKGVDKRGVFPLKTIADAERIFSCTSKKVVVIGSGPIGVEAAASLRKKGLAVGIIEVLNRILPRLFDDKPAALLREIIEDHGVNIFTGEKVIEILGNGAVRGLATDKRQIECDAIIIAAGVRSNTELARQMGLEIGNLGGINTDEHMMTSMEDVYACGDCAQSRDLFTGESAASLLWHNAKKQGWVAGCNCVGKQSKFIGSFDATTVEIFGIYASSIGRSAACFENQSGYDLIEKTSDSNYQGLIVVDNRLIGVQLINKTEHAGLLFSRMLRKDNLVELRKVVHNKKLLSMRPWNYLVGQHIT